MTLEGDKKFDIGPHNDKRTIGFLVERFGQIPMSVTLNSSQCEELMSDLHDALNDVASLGYNSDDVDAMSWVNSLWAMTSLIVGLSRVSENGHFTGAFIRIG
jgi:hypothetical protein